MLMVGLAFIKIKSLSIRGPQTNGEEVFPQKCSLSMEEIKRGNYTGILYFLDFMWNLFPREHLAFLYQNLTDMKYVGFLHFYIFGPKFWV